MSQNIVLVTIDSLRADHCGFLGGPDGLTPTLDSLAEDGLVFERAIAPGPRTPSSVPVTFTGEFVQRPNLGVYEDYEEKSASHMERHGRIRRHVERYRTVPERLRAAGYDTAGVTANPWTTANTGFDAGFDVFEAVTEREDVTPESLPVASRLARAAGANVDEWFLTWPDFYDVVLQAREQLSEPYFLWVFLLDPHQPYLTPRACREENSALGMYYANVRYNRSFGYTDDLPAHLDERLRRAYRDAVRSSDAFVDRLRDDLADDDPALAVHADHGEAFADHGAYGHRLQCYRENVHVPLLVHNAPVDAGPAIGDDREPGDARVDDGCGDDGRVDDVRSGDGRSSVDGARAGTGPSTGGRFGGLAALRHLGDGLLGLARDGAFDPSALERDVVVSRTEEGERVGARSDRWAFVEADPAFEAYLHDYRPRELYDLDADPGERTDLADERPAVADAFAAYLRGRDADRREREVVAEAVEEFASRI